MLTIQSRYFCKEGATGSDAQVGRIAAGLPVTDVAFATLPPHFVKNPPTIEELRLIFPHYDYYPDSFRSALPFLLASLVFVSSFIFISAPSYARSIVITFAKLIQISTQYSKLLYFDERISSKGLNYALRLAPGFFFLFHFLHIIESIKHQV